MQKPRSSRRFAGNILLAAGLVILLGVAGYFGWSQIQAAELRAQLRQTVTPAQPAPSATAQPTFTPAPAPAATFTPTALPPTPTPTTTPGQPAPAATRTSTAPPATRQPATRQPPTATITATAVPPTPAPAALPASIGASPVRLLIADLKVDTKVVPMGWEVVQTAAGLRSEWVIPKDEAGHHIDSARLGQPGNLVISGHNNIYAQVFKPISFAWDNDQRVAVDAYTDRSDILNGRQIQLFDEAGQPYTYVIKEFYRLKDTGVPQEQRVINARFMQPTTDNRLTIITCWPPTNNTHRLIVVAAPVE